MGVTGRRSVDLGIVRLNFTLNGLSSYTIRVFPRVSWNSRTRRWTVDLPGPLKWTSQPTGRRAQA